MIIEEEVVVEVQVIPKHTKKIKRYICDICKKELRNTPFICCFCGKEICYECVIRTYYHPLTEEGAGDYNYNHCITCEDTAKKYKDEYVVLKEQIEELEKQLESVEENWRIECTHQK